MLVASVRSSASRGVVWLRGQAARRMGSSTSTTPTSSASSTSAPPPPAGYSTGTKTEGFLQGTVKTHYTRNHRALNRIGVSFLVFYISGQIYVQKCKRDELEAEMTKYKTGFHALEKSLTDDKWTKEAAGRLGVSSQGLKKEINLLLRKAGAGDDTESHAEADAVVGQKGGPAVAIY